MSYIYIYITSYISIILQSQAHIVHHICDGSREQRLHQRSQGFRALLRRNHAQGGDGEAARHLAPTCGDMRPPKKQLKAWGDDPEKCEKWWDFVGFRGENRWEKRLTKWRNTMGF